MSWRALTYPPGAEVIEVGPTGGPIIMSLSVHAPYAWSTWWSWQVDGHAFAMLPNAIDARATARRAAIDAAQAWVAQGLRDLAYLDDCETAAANLSGRARRNAWPWHWWNDRLRPQLRHDLPFDIDIQQAAGGCFAWRAAHESGEASVEAHARIFATTAAVKVLRTAANVLGECRAKGAA